jgi:hypothetical protein
MDYSNLNGEELTEHLNKLKATCFRCNCGSVTYNPLSYSNHLKAKHNDIPPPGSSHTSIQAKSIRNEILKIERKLKD